MLTRRNMLPASATNQISRRALLAGIAAAPFVRSASAQAAWPNRPVQVMVPYPPAGGADTTARILYAKVGAMLGQQFVIENRGGAGGTIGEAVVAKAAPDGYTILHDATAHSINGALYSNLSFDYNRDFDAVALVSLVPNILVVTPSLPVKTMADVIAYAKAAPDGIDRHRDGPVRRRNEDRRRAVFGTQLPEQFESRTVGLPDFQEDADRCAAFCIGQQRRTVSEADDVVAIFLQRTRQHFPRRRIIVDDEYLALGNHIGSHTQRHSFSPPAKRF